MKKKSLLLILVMLSTLTASAYDAYVGGIYYNFSGTEATVTSGDVQYTGIVTIPATVTYNDVTYSVTSIGDLAFNNCSGLTSVTIPNSVTAIGHLAFARCSELSSVTIPDNVVSIGQDAFYGTAWYNNQPDGLVYAGLIAYKYKGNMPSNTSITIKEGTIGIAVYAFRDCSGLTSVTIPNSVTAIGAYAFSYCYGLISVTIPNSVIEIESGAFYGCSSLRSVTIPNSVTAMGDGIFEGTAWYNNQPNGLVYAGKVAYKYKGTMPENTSIILKDGTLGIAVNALSECSNLTEVTIPNSVIEIGGGAFSGCSGLTEVIIPNSVTSIGESAFWGCSGLTEVYCFAEIIPNTGYSVFYNVPTSSATLYVPATSVDAYKATKPWSGFGTIKSIPEETPEINPISYEYNTSSQEATVIAGDTKYTGNVTIPETTMHEDVTYSVTAIGDSAFEECSDLTSVTIPNSVTFIGDNAFTNCTSLTELNFGDGVSYIGSNAFRNCTELSSITIPNSVIEISSMAFLGCDNLTSVTIPGSVTKIGTDAFSSCRCLKDVTIENGVTEIRLGAFAACRRLASVTIPSSVTAIGKHVFEGCLSLTDVYCYAEEVPTTDSDVFNEVDLPNATLHVPTASIDAYKTAMPWSGFGTIKSFSGEEPETKKCATPTINFVNGKLEFSCETVDVEFVAKVTSPSTGDYEGSSIPLTSTYIVSVYAKKEGYQDSDVATKEVEVSSGSTAKKGDVNEDGQVNGTDIQEVINIIVEGE